MTQPKRSDYRTAPPGTFTHYLLNDYLLKRSYSPRGSTLSSHVLANPHYTNRNESGQWVRTEMGGVPAQKEQLINHLDGYTWQVVRFAIEAVRRQNPDFVAALEYYQQPAPTRPSREVWASAHGIAVSTVSYRFAAAVRMVEASLSWARSQYEAGESA